MPEVSTLVMKGLMSRFHEVEKIRKETLKVITFSPAIGLALKYQLGLSDKKYKVFFRANMNILKEHLSNEFYSLKNNILYPKFFLH